MTIIAAAITTADFLVVLQPFHFLIIFSIVPPVSVMWVVQLSLKLTCTQSHYSSLIFLQSCLRALDRQIRLSG